MKKRNIIAGMTIPMLVLVISCQGQDAKVAQETGAKPLSVVAQLGGAYNATEDLWENPDTAYERFIRFDGEEFASFNRMRANGDLGPYGILDKSGNVVVQPNYFSITTKPRFGFFEVQDSLQQVGLVNTKGIEVVSPQYKSIFLDAELMKIDSTIIKVAKDEKQGFIDYNGNVVVPLKYPSLEVVDKNRIMYMESPQHWGLMDYKGKILTAAVFTHTNIFVDGKVILQQADGQEYSVDVNGKIIKR